jgi:SAM-dependent methyltransferase
MSNPATDPSTWLARLRSDRLRPFVRPSDTVFEYGLRDELNLIGITAGRRLGLPAEGTNFKPSRIEIVKDLSAVKDVHVVLCDHVLEYLTDPVELLMKFKNVLAPGGTLIVFALYDKAFMNPKIAESGKHFYSWNVQTLGNLLIDCGYEFQSGAMKRYPNEKYATRLAPLNLGEMGFQMAAALSRLFALEFELRVAAKRP